MTDQAIDTTIFPNGNPEPTNSVVDPLADLLKTITAPDGRQKYDSAEAVLKAMPDAQKHISTLEGELQTIKSEKEAMQAKLDSMFNVDQSLQNVARRESEQTRPVSKELDEQTIMELVTRQLQEKESLALMKSNQHSVVEALSSKFGDKAEEVYQNKARELGMDVATLNSIAGNHPKAVLAYFASQGASTPKTTSSSLNTNTLQGQPADKPKNPMLMGGNMKAYWSDLEDRVVGKG